MTESILRLENLVKRYGSHTVLEGISADVGRGDVIGVLGLNGAGKTTLLETALGFAIPDEGSAKLFDCASSAIEDQSLKHRVGFVPQQDELLEGMTGGQFLALIRRFYPRWNQASIERWSRDWDVPLERTVSKLSVGQRQKLSILAALGHEPELIILDEPVASLDPLARRKFLQELIGLVSTGERTIIFSTHIVSDLERVANRVWILKNGVLAIDEPLDHLKESRVVAREAVGAGLPALPGIETDRSLEEIFLELHR